jgi:DNA polymerase
MPDNSAFQEFYLREIGVHTPVSLHLSTASAGDDTVEPQVSPKHAPERAATEHKIPAKTEASENIEALISDNPLQDLAIQAASCTACQLSEQRHSVVFGVGNPEAEIVFIGEAPGREEDLKGEPFVGRAGQLLDRMLAAQGLDREQVYIMNTVKCRPPNNRDPKPEEVQACGRWFDAQLKALSPKLICLLGRVAAQTLLETDASLSAMRGKWHDYHGIPLRVLYHPAYLLRSPQQKRHAWSDLCELKKRYQLLSD